MMDTGTLQILVMIGGFAVTLSAFFLAKSKESENRGRLMQRVDTLEAMITEMRERTRVVEQDVACHDTDLSTVTVEIDGLKKLIEKIDRKLDDYFDRRDHQKQDQRQS